MENEIISKIYNECREQFEFEEKIRSLVQNDIVRKINKYINSIESDENNLIYRAITTLVCQGIRNYDSSMLLIHNGYATNALVNLRQMVEILFETEYIFENDKAAYYRAKQYLQGENNVGKKKKSVYSFNMGLYDEYKMLCEHSHANISALNVNKNSIKANNILVKKASLVVNSTFYYFLECIFKYYEIDKKIIENIDIPKSIQNHMKTYCLQRDIYNYFFKTIMRFTDEDISELQIDKKYKNFQMEQYYQIKNEIKK